MGKNPTSDLLAAWAVAQRGFRAYDFSQAMAFTVVESMEPHQGKLYKMVLRDGKPMGGVCATLCAFWIVFHAMQDRPGGNSFTKSRSVWEYLFNDGGLNTGAATNIVVEHHQSAGNQYHYLDNFLKQFKIYMRTKSIAGTSLPDAYMPLSSSTAVAVAKLITSVNGYKMLSLKKTASGDGAGHAVSAWSDGADVLFMDPNYGEFWLPSKAAFEVWFQQFWDKVYVSSYKSLRPRTYVAGNA